MNIFIFLVIILLVVTLARWQNQKELEWIDRCRATYENHRRAREERLLWLAAHQYLPEPKSHPDYEWLWLFEIGAEMLIVDFNDMARDSSYREYLAEKEGLAADPPSLSFE